MTSPIVRTMPAPTVSTAGAARDATTAKITRQIPALGAGHLGYPGGLLAATAEATMTEPGTVTTAQKLSPWNRTNAFPPVDGDPATIDIDGQRRFTGWVEDVHGSAHQDVTVAMVDAVDRLRRPVTIEPLANNHPHSLSNQGVGRIDHIALRAEWIIYRAMRAAGYEPLTPPHAAARRHIPMMGSLIARDGTMPVATPGQATEWVPGPWGGLAVRGATATWPVSGVSHGEADLIFYVTGPAVSVAAIQLTLRLGTTRRGGVDVSFPQAGRIRFASGVGGTITHTVTVDRDDTKPIRWTRTGGSTGPWSLWYGDDQIVPPTAFSINYTIDTLDLRSAAESQVAVGPIYVGPAGQAISDGAPTATIRAGTALGSGTLGALPYIENVQIMQLLSDIARAQGAGMWLTPTGHLHYAHPDVLEAQEPTATITSEADLLDVAWSMSVRDVRRKVYVTCRAPEVQTAPEDSVLLFTGSPETFQGLSAARDEWVTPGADEDWLTHRMAESTRQRSINQPVLPVDLRGQEKGVWWGGAVIIGTAETQLAPYMGVMEFAMEQVTSQAVTYRQAIEVDPQEADKVAFRIPGARFNPATAEDLAYWNGTGLPILRGMGKITWSTVRHTSTATGPEPAADWTHDVGPWVQGAACQALANWLGARMTTPRPLLRELPVVWRDDIELGQVVTVHENVVYGFELKALVIGVREEHTAKGGARMWLTLRLLDHDRIPGWNFGDGWYGDGPYGGN